jgi:hypothetical protein
MKKTIFTVLALAAMLAGSIPVSAVPRLQTYIVDSHYSIYHPRYDVGTWISNSSNFDLKVVGYWGAGSGSSMSGSFGRRPLYQAPSYDFMDCYLAMSVPRNQMGRIYINGVEISSFQRWRDAIPAGTNPSRAIPLTGPSLGGKFSFMNIGRVDNSAVNAWHYGYGRISSHGWGDEINLDVTVRGFSWAHFDAIGVDSEGRTITNSQLHDSSYYATPEPSTLSLLGLGLLGIAPLLRRRNR